MKRRITMELALDMNEVRTALRLQHPEIPPNASVRAVYRPGNGPGAYRNDKGSHVQPWVLVTFDLPEPEDAPKETP